MSEQFKVGDRVELVDSPYPTALPNGLRGTITKVTEFPTGRVYCVYVLADDVDHRSPSGREGGAWCLYPREVKHVREAPAATPPWSATSLSMEVAGRAVERKLEAVLPAPARGTKENPILCDFVLVKTSRGFVQSNAAAPDNLPRHKWNTPGRHKISSYRSFRRYKAAGAGFVVKTAGFDNLADGCFVAISVNKARQRAQDGLDIYAEVAE